MGEQGNTAIADINLRIELQRLAGQAADRGDGPLAAILGAAVRFLDDRIQEAERSISSEPQTSAALVCRNVRVRGRRTSVKLEREFWHALEAMASRSNCTVTALCDTAHRLKGSGSLTSALRVLILRNSSTPGVSALDS